MTLRLTEDGTVVMVLLPEPFHGLPDCVAVTSSSQTKGLSLHSVSFSLLEHLEGRARAR